MEEGTDDEVARVGTITDAQVEGHNVLLEYVYSADAPALINSAIYANRADFGLQNDFEFSRTHWAVKNVDLFRVILRHNQHRRQRPSVFQITEYERLEPSLVSVMMPYDAAFAEVYEAISASAVTVQLRTRRADEI
jgi:hypothetical protein